MRRKLLNKPFLVGDNVEIEKNTVKIYVNATDFGEFWGLYSEDSWEPETFKVFDKFIRPDFAYMDIGAWIGPTVLYGANFAKKVYAFEPDKAAFSQLQQNIALNEALKSKITVFEMGLSGKDSQEKFYTGKGATSMSSVIPNNQNESDFYYVNFSTLETVVNSHHIDFKEVNFCKIDIEGGEYELLPNMVEFLQKSNHFPTLYISTHIPFFFGKEMTDDEKQAISDEKNTKLFEILRKNYQYLYNSRFELIDNAKQISGLKFSELIATNIEL